MPRPVKIKAGDRVRLRIEKKNLGGMVFPAGLEVVVLGDLCGLLSLARPGDAQNYICGVAPADVELVTRKGGKL